MNNDDLARQKRDYEEQIFRDHGAEIKHTPTPRTDALENSLLGKVIYSAIVEAIEFARKLERENARLLSQNEAMKSALEEVTNLLAYYPRDEASEVIYKAARAALNPPPTK